MVSASLHYAVGVFVIKYSMNYAALWFFYSLFSACHNYTACTVHSSACSKQKCQAPKCSNVWFSYTSFEKWILFTIIMIIYTALFLGILEFLTVKLTVLLIVMYCFVGYFFQSRKLYERQNLNFWRVLIF